MRVRVAGYAFPPAASNQRGLALWESKATLGAKFMVWDHLATVLLCRTRARERPAQEFMGGLPTFSSKLLAGLENIEWLRLSSAGYAFPPRGYVRSLHD